MDATNRMPTRATKRPKNISYPLEVKERTLDKIESGEWDRTTARKNVGCSPQTIKNWIDAKENNKVLHGFSHRPSYISPELEAELIEHVHQESKKGRAVLKRKFGDELQKKVDTTRKTQKKTPVTLNPRYVRDKVRKHNLKKGKAEVETNAHEVAAKDPRHAASFAAMLEYLRSRVPEDQFINLDKTSFDWLNADQETEQAVYSGERPQSLKVSASKSPKVKGNCSVQVYVVASSGGTIGDIVYLVKDREMKAGEIDVYSAPMLAVGNCGGTTSHLMFVGESHPNHDEALKWVLEHVVIPFGNVLRTGETRDPTSYVSLTVDGDPRQLQVITEEHTRGLFTQARFIVGKSPASCTPIYQPLDAGRLFLASKTRFNAIMEQGSTHLSEKESADLKIIFQRHRQRHPVKVKRGGLPSTALSPYLNNVIKCLPAIAKALTDAPVRTVVRESFRITGVAPFSAEAVRNKCRYEWTKAEERQFDLAVPELSKRFAVNFELKESDFDELHIPANNKPKDGVSVHMRRALLLYAPQVLQALQEQAAKSKKK